MRQTTIKVVAVCLGSLASFVALEIGLRPTLYNPDQLSQAGNSFPATMARYLVRHGSLQGYEVIPLEHRFIEEHRKSGKRFEFPYNNHWNASGHAIMA